MRRLRETATRYDASIIAEMFDPAFVAAAQRRWAERKVALAARRKWMAEAHAAIMAEFADMTTEELLPVINSLLHGLPRHTREATYREGLAAAGLVILQHEHGMSVQEASPAVGAEQSKAVNQ